MSLSDILCISISALAVMLKGLDLGLGINDFASRFWSRLHHWITPPAMGVQWFCPREDLEI